MKKLNFIQLFAMIIICITAFTFSAIAGEQTQKELKIKTNYVTKDSKYKLETVASLLKGVSEAQFNTEKKELCVKYDPAEINSDMIVYALSILGYDSEIIEDKEIDKLTQEKQTKEASVKK